MYSNVKCYMAEAKRGVRHTQSDSTNTENRIYKNTAFVVLRIVI